MHKSVILSLLGLFLIGCNSQRQLETSKLLVYQGSELATMVSLKEADASIDDASRIGAIAIAVKMVLNDDGTDIDHTSLKREIFEEITSYFEADTALIFTALCDTIYEIIVAEIRNNPKPLEENLLIFIKKAAEGVENAANIYITVMSN